MSWRAAGLAALLAASAAAAASAVEPAFAADARVDLVGLLQRLSGDPSAARNPVSDAAAARFARWAGHPAAARLARMRERGFGGIVPAQYALYLTPLPDVKEAVPAPVFFIRRAGGRSELAAWRRELADFVRASDYAGWWAGREAARAEELAAVRAGADRDLGGPLARLLGARVWSTWTVLVSPFFQEKGGAAWVVEEKAGRPDVYVVYGPSWREGSLVPETPLDFAEGALPEAIYVMAYALYEVCRPALSAARPVCAPGVGGPENCVHLHWVRAVSAALVGELWGPHAERGHRRRWPGGPLQAEVDRAFAAYAADRRHWPDMMDARAHLAAPFLGGRESACELFDRGRYPQALFARRLAAYLEARLERRPDAEARAELERLRSGGTLSAPVSEAAPAPSGPGLTEGGISSPGR